MFPTELELRKLPIDVVSARDSRRIIESSRQINNLLNYHIFLNIGMNTWNAQMARDLRRGRPATSGIFRRKIAPAIHSLRLPEALYAHSNAAKIVKDSW